VEFALFDAQTCSDVAVQLIGYSVTQDRVIQYPFRSNDEPGDAKPWFWMDNLFAHKPTSRGYWHYTMTLPGSNCIFDSDNLTPFFETVIFGGCLPPCLRPGDDHSR
jgi:hypothetical protein